MDVSQSHKPAFANPAWNDMYNENITDLCKPVLSHPLSTGVHECKASLTPIPQETKNNGKSKIKLSTERPIPHELLRTRNVLTVNTEQTKTINMDDEAIGKLVQQMELTNAKEISNIIDYTVELRSEIEGKYGIGTGCIVRIDQSFGFAYVLTAAHNVVCRDDTEPENSPSASGIWLTALGNQKIDDKGPAAAGFDWDPSYTDDSENIQNYRLYDRAVIWFPIKKLQKYIGNNDDYIANIPPMKFAKPQKEYCPNGFVFGFPAKKAFKDRVFGQSGPVFWKGKKDGFIGYTHSNIATFPGMSGAPIMLKKRKEKGKGHRFEIVGVHTNGGTANDNYGAALNIESMKFVEEIINGDMIKRAEEKLNEMTHELEECTNKVAAEKMKERIEILQESVLKSVVNQYNIEREREEEGKQWEERERWREVFEKKREIERGKNREQCRFM